MVVDYHGLSGDIGIMCIPKTYTAKEFLFMKKLALLALVLLTSFAIISCTTSREDSPAASSDGVVDTVDVSDATSTVISEPVEQVDVAETGEEGDTIVIDTSIALTADDPEIEQKFSYVYGHLMGQGISDQEIALVPRHFIAGSSDFYNYVEPALTEEQINNLFQKYQGYLDGSVSESELQVVDLEPIGEMSSFYDFFSYGYGYVVQYNLQSQGILVVLDNFNNGINDAFSEVPLNYSDEEIDTLFIAYQDKLRAEYNAALEEFAAQNLEAAENFLAENATAEGVITTESGLQYKVVSEGEGALPTDDDTVEVDYMITYLDGTTGDNSYSRGTPSVFALANLIPGFAEGVKLMPVGSHYRFYVHPDMAYGVDGTQDIPPNTLLIFDVELHNIVTE